MISPEVIMEEKDDFNEFFQQYRPQNRSSFSPMENFSYSRRNYPGSSDTGTESYTDTLSSGYSTGHAANNRDVQFSNRRPQPNSRSKSQGREYNRADLMNFYYSRPRTAETEQVAGYTNQLQTSPEDTLSRDSGHSSGGTPEFGRRSIVRYNSFPQPRQVAQADVYGNNENLVDERPNYSSRIPFDSYSLYGGFSENQNIKNSDSMSLHSFDTQKQNWRYMEDRPRPRIILRRKYSPNKSFNTTDIKNMNKASRTNSEVITESKTTSTETSTPSDVRYARLLGFLLVGVTLAAVSKLLLTSYESLKCSSSNSEALNIELLATKLSSNLIGQPLAMEQVIHHMKTFSEHENKPVMVLLLVGMTGSGKTHTINQISQIFPIQSNVFYIHEILRNPQPVSDIPRVIRQSCGYSLVIMDDLDDDNKMVVSSIERMVVTISNDANSKSKGTLIVVSTKATAMIINKYLLELSKDNLSKRDKVTVDDIMVYLKQENAKVPLQKSIVDFNVPVHVVPFLPMTREHVRDCISSELRNSNSQMKTKDVNSLLDNMSFFSPDFPIFSTDGCKQVSHRVNTFVGHKREL